MKSYQSLADSYDALMADAEHRRRAAFLMRAFRKSKPAVHTVLDLACGTGTIACLPVSYTQLTLPTNMPV